jgi:transcription elongation factor
LNLSNEENIWGGLDGLLIGVRVNSFRRGQRGAYHLVSDLSHDVIGMHWHVDNEKMDKEWARLRRRRGKGNETVVRWHLLYSSVAIIMVTQTTGVEGPQSTTYERCGRP